MNFILELLPVLPIATMVAALSYAVFLLVIRRNGIPKCSKLLSQFMLVGWVVLFLYITQIKPFGNGLGELYNLKPLHMFYVALRYGSNNASLTWQFLLNILMFVPLGFLLPIVFGEKMRTWPKIFLVSFCTSLSTELLQLVSRRGTDIDDLIANTVGGLCGFSVFLLALSTAKFVFRRKFFLPYFKRNVAFGFAVLFFTGMPFIVIAYRDGTSVFGNLYYGHLRPAAVVSQINVDQTPTAKNVYQYDASTSVTDLQERLLSASGFHGQFTEDENSSQLQEGDAHRIFISDYDRWSVFYAYGEQKPIDKALIPDENEAIALAWEFLSAYQITPEEVSFSHNESDQYGDENQHLLFKSNQVTAEQMAYGSLRVTIGENGALIEIADNRIGCKAVQTVACISPYAAFDIAAGIGVGNGGTAYVTSVTEGYAFIESTGYVIPTWEMSGTMIFPTGESSPWAASIDAVK